MSNYWDSRGGKREGAGRPKLEEEKKAFRVTKKEKDLVYKLRDLDEQQLYKIEKVINKEVQKNCFY